MKQIVENAVCWIMNGNAYVAFSVKASHREWCEHCILAAELKEPRPCWIWWDTVQPRNDEHLARIAALGMARSSWEGMVDEHYFYRLALDLGCNDAKVNILPEEFGGTIELP